MLEREDSPVSFRRQFTVRGMLIGCVGTVVITMSSMFVALKISALPWPIIFVALASMFALKACGQTNINEINVTHTAMSAGAMVAGGLAFTLPGLWMLDPNAQVQPGVLLVVTLGGVVLGLIFTALLRKYFIVSKALPFPMGQAAAETLLAGDAGGKKAALLFSSLGVAAVFTFFRDWLAKIPSVLWFSSMTAYGSLGGLWLSPMLVSVGYIIGPLAIGVWFVGALIGDCGILIGGQALGWLDAAEAASIKSSLGIGLMVGAGVGIIIKGILPKAKEIFAPMFSRKERGGAAILRWSPLLMAVIAALLTLVAQLPLVASLLTILGVWLATAMSAQCVGQSGINPMEIFGIIVLLAVKAVSAIGQTEAFFVAAVVAVACGLVGDVMNDFKSGHLLHSDPKAQWLAESIGSLIGAVVSVAVLLVILRAYGGEVFGSETFPAAQASAVSAMVGGISNLPAFWIGLGLAVLLYVLNVPVMTLGLGVYLPFYLSATAFLGVVVKVVLDKVAPAISRNGHGQIVAAGLLGGEAVAGVIIALIIAVTVMA